MWLGAGTGTPAGTVSYSPAVIPRLYAWPQKCLHGRRLRNFFTRRCQPRAKVQPGGLPRVLPLRAEGQVSAGLSSRAVGKAVLLPGFEMQATCGFFLSFFPPSEGFLNAVRLLVTNALCPLCLLRAAKALRKANFAAGLELEKL